MEDLINIVNSLNNKGVSFHSLQENITMDGSVAKFENQTSPL